MEPGIYGNYKPVLEDISKKLVEQLKKVDQMMLQESGEHLFEHISARIKSEDSMREKCRRKGVAETTYSALKVINDGIGLRIVCSFMDDIETCISYLRTIPKCRIIKEKDYIKHAKDNGYRSFHLILEIEDEHEDVEGMCPGHFYAEVQLRTIAMDSWASLEHRLNYKKEKGDPDRHALIVRELKKCADELASCDIKMQTIRKMIAEENGRNDT